MSLHVRTRLARTYGKVGGGFLFLFQVCGVGITKSQYVISGLAFSVALMLTTRLLIVLTLAWGGM